MTFIRSFLNLFPRTSLRKAIDYLSSGDYAKACNYFEIYISKNDYFCGNSDKHELIRMYISEAYIEYAKALKEKGKYQEAYDLLLKMIKIAPDYSDVFYMCADLNEKLGRTEEAVKNIRRALSINPNYFNARIFYAKLLYLSKKRPEKSVAELKDSLSRAPGFYINKVNKLIREIINGTDKDEVIRQFISILREKPSSVQVSRQIALENIQRGQYDSAISELKKALSLKPDFADLHNLLGIAYANKGAKDDAIMELKTALKINPEYLKAHLNIALTYFECGFNEESSKHLERVLQIDPGNELAVNLKKELVGVLN